MDQYLEHYGVKGMKWGKHKKSIDRTSKTYNTYERTSSAENSRTSKVDNNRTSKVTNRSGSKTGSVRSASNSAHSPSERRLRAKQKSSTGGIVERWASTTFNKNEGKSASQRKGASDRSSSRSRSKENSQKSFISRRSSQANFSSRSKLAKKGRKYIKRKYGL